MMCQHGVLGSAPEAGHSVMMVSAAVLVPGLATDDTEQSYTGAAGVPKFCSTPSMQGSPITVFSRSPICWSPPDRSFWQIGTNVLRLGNWSRNVLIRIGGSATSVCPLRSVYEHECARAGIAVFSPGGVRSSTAN